MSTKKNSMNYKADPTRYEKMPVRRCGKSGLILPEISLGLWHNFGGIDVFENGREIILKAFDSGIFHFDLANNYGPPPGSAEENFGKILKQDLAPYREELVISTKAGYRMWEGPFGEWGSRKYLVASLDQSLKRMGLDYVDIYYSHRFDPDTDIEETLYTLHTLVQQGKALYVGISSYSAEQTQQAVAFFKEFKTPFVIHQPRYNMFDRWIENGLVEVLEKNKLGSIVFSPLEQGLLSTRYLDGIPGDSRAARGTGNFDQTDISQEKLEKIKQLNELAQNRGQTLAQMALAWILRLQSITSVLIGPSRLSQMEENIRALENKQFSPEELDRIDEIMAN